MSLLKLPKADGVLRYRLGTTQTVQIARISARDRMNGILCEPKSNRAARSVGRSPSAEKYP